MTDDNYVADNLTDDELRQHIMDKSQFMPVDLTRQPIGAPEHMNALDMYTEGLDRMLKTHVKALTLNPDMERLTAERSN